jgi:hypothetical protein
LKIASDQALVRVKRKLPDDLLLSEYSELVQAVAALCHGAGSALIRDDDSSMRREPRFPAKVMRSQYGSDFMLLVGVATDVATLIGVIALAVKLLAQSVHENAGAVRDISESNHLDAQARKTNAEAALLEYELSRRMLSERRRMLNGPKAQEDIALVIAEQLSKAGYEDLAIAVVDSLDKSRRPFRLERHQKRAAKWKKGSAAELLSSARVLLIYNPDVVIEVDHTD